MQEKQKELFEQYDMELLHIRRGRRGIVCETNRGAYDLQMCSYSPKRLEQAYEIKEQLMQKGFLYVDQYMRNKEGELLTYDRYQTAYVMKRHFDGKECDIKNQRDIKAAGEQLGNLHQMLRRIQTDGYPVKKTGFEQKTRELLRTKQYLTRKNEKKEFEVLFQRYFDLFAKEMKQVPTLHGYIPRICHGCCHQHHLIILPEKEMAVIHFEQFYVGNQLEDVFYLLRKILEKNHYEFFYGQIFLEAYARCCPLKKEEYEDLYAMLFYPEKYWKLANQYMNRRKTFLSPKLTEKLLEIVELEKRKVEFLQMYCSYYLQKS